MFEINLLNEILKYLLSASASMPVLCAELRVKKAF